MDRLRVLFLCIGNSARSPMAEAILTALTHGQIDVQSAGTAPEAVVHPMAITTMRDRHGADIAGHTPRAIGPFVGQHFDYVFTLCDTAAEACPDFPGDPSHVHWNFPDPAAVEGSPDQQQHAFNVTAAELATRLGIWLALPEVRSRVDAAAESREEAHQ